jgi:hypothetical protein
MVVTEFSSRLVPDESERIWKEAIVTWWRYYPGVWREELWKTMRNLSALPYTNLFYVYWIRYDNCNNILTVTARKFPVFITYLILLQKDFRKPARVSPVFLWVGSTNWQFCFQLLLCEFYDCIDQQLYDQHNVCFWEVASWLVSTSLGRLLLQHNSANVWPNFILQWIQSSRKCYDMFNPI